MGWGQELVLAIVEGVTEFLPVSSTGHLVLTSWILGVSQSEFVKSFEITVQLGAICAIGVLYWRKFLVETETLKRIIAAFVPTGIIGMLFYKLVKTYLLGNWGVTIMALAVGGIILLIWENKRQIPNPKSQIPKKFQISNLDFWRCVVIGIGQAVAMVPGVSRALVTIITGEAVGLSRKEAVEFSFLLAVPTMAAATGWDLMRSGWGFLPGEWAALGVGFGISALVAGMTVKWLVDWVRKHNLSGFGWYRLAVAAVFALSAYGFF